MKINGMAKALRQLQQLEVKIIQVAQEEINKTANKIVQEAKSAAPGSIPGTIGATIIQPLGAQVFAGNNELAAYQEFGTGNFAKEYVASLPPDVQAEALTFFVTGKGHGHPQPFFFPAIFKNSPELLDNIEKELQKLANK